jgi:membrane protease YdiL (CAAX protease family)
LIGLWTVFALLAGVLFAGLTLLRGTILSAVIAHAIVNAVNLRRLVTLPLPDPAEP